MAMTTVIPQEVEFRDLQNEKCQFETTVLRISGSLGQVPVVQCDCATHYVSAILNCEAQLGLRSSLGGKSWLHELLLQETAY
jgi:hypothetical protein